MQHHNAAQEVPVFRLSLSGLAEDSTAEISHLLLRALNCIQDDESVAIDLVRKASALLQPTKHRTEPRQAYGGGGLAAWQVTKVQAFILDRIEGAILLSQLAAVAKLSASYFSVAFKASFGLPPHAYVMKCRVEHAKELILDTDLPLCEIALNAGLADQAHLCRVFKRFTGMTPSAWRRIKLSVDKGAVRRNYPASGQHSPIPFERVRSST